MELRLWPKAWNCIDLANNFFSGNQIQKLLCCRSGEQHQSSVCSLFSRFITLLYIYYITYTLHYFTFITLLYYITLLYITLLHLLHLFITLLLIYQYLLYGAEIKHHTFHFHITSTASTYLAHFYVQMN